MFLGDRNPENPVNQPTKSSSNDGRIWFVVFWQTITRKSVIIELNRQAPHLRDSYNSNALTNHAYFIQPTFVLSALTVNQRQQPVTGICTVWFMLEECMLIHHGAVRAAAVYPLLSCVQQYFLQKWHQSFRFCEPPGLTNDKPRKPILLLCLSKVGLPFRNVPGFYV